MNKIFNNLLIFITILAFQGFINLNAQDVPATTVTGQVLDKSGQPQQGITVKSFNLKNSVVTGENGSFSIEVTSQEPDRIVISEPKFKLLVVTVEQGTSELGELVIEERNAIDPDNEISLPYTTLKSSRVPGAVSVITGEELESYPADNLLEALQGRIPGLTVNQYNFMPGMESFGAYIRGVGATIYIDGIPRDITGLSASEVKTVEVIKDMTGRAALGLSGAGPVIWITTKDGDQFDRKITVSAETGLRTPTTLPNYLGAYDYATLYNEARVNDGLSEYYSQEQLDGYQSQSNPTLYPDIDYYDKYVNSTAPFTRGNINFQGGDDRVNYFTAFTYFNTKGLESMGEVVKDDRYKLRGNVNIRLNEFMKLGVNIAGSYNTSRYPNTGGGSGVFNMFDVFSRYPANAHPESFNDKLIISDDYPTNVANELMYAGFAEGQVFNAQNTAKLSIDLGGITEGLSFDARASFDIINQIIQTKGGTAALHRIENIGGIDTAVLIVPEENDVTMSIGNNYVTRRTEAMTALNYEKESGQHSLLLNAVFYMGLNETRVTWDGYQPGKMQDYSLRVNYDFADKYIIQADLSYSGSMRMPEDERFSLYPTVGAAWIASNEGFLSESTFVDYLKLHSSFGIMGIGNYSLSGYNPYYLYETLWGYTGSWRSGVPGNYGPTANIYEMLQNGSSDFKLPKKRYFNVGVQGQLMDEALSFELNYFNERNYDKISARLYSTPSLIGTDFLQATNYGEDVRWGVDGSLQYSGKSGDFSYSLGVNAMYLRGKHVVVDELDYPEEYRTRTGKDLDLFWIYNAEGLYQSDTEITDRDVSQAWGGVQPGDIRYEDKNGDGLVDNRDVYAPGAHSPRLFYGTTLSLGYKNLKLFVAGQGVANGDLMLYSNRYFRINDPNQAYSEFMLDRYPVTNDVPRLTTSSQNNVQNSTFWVRSAAYFKIRNVELSYRLPVNASRMMFMTDSRIFVRGTNLLSVSGLKDYGLDPENIDAGITGYPVFRTFTAGVSFSF
ncbi:MAG: SusC/RagA family TonB-linked outer membrane protein [Bacteroidales bacterium]|nr:SusC/RagA family TonB-linked outer membrane protein [Bacteroidales bacterium]